MAVDMFLKIDGIPGGSADSKHKDEIEVMSYSWGLTQTGTMAFGGGGGAGKVQFQDFHFAQEVGKASPLLFKSCASGQHIKVATLTVRKAGESQQEFLQIKLNDVLISSYSSSGASGGDAVPVDQFSINFAKIEYAVTTQEDTGRPSETLKAGWDLKANKAV